MNYKISNLSLNDLGQVVQIERELHPKTTWSRKIFCELLNNQNNLSYVLSLEKELVIGFFCAEVVFKEAYLLNIGIKETFQKKGFGKKLLDFLINKVRELKLASLSLEVNQDNSQAIKLYQSRGFQEIGVRKKYYNQKDDALIMTLNL